MAHKLKALGLASVAVFALSAMTASVSQAAEFTPEQETVVGEQITGNVTGVTTAKHEFRTDAGVTKCTTTTFDGSLPQASHEVTITPTYSSCTTVGINSPVDMNGCDYRFKPGAAGIATEVVCPTGNITVTVPNCTVTVFPQNFAEGMITYTNSGVAPDMHVTTTIDITGITYELNGTGCGTGVTTGMHLSDGTYKGVATLHHGTIN